MCFPREIAKFLNTPILKNIYKRTLVKVSSQRFHNALNICSRIYSFIDKNNIRSPKFINFW